MVWPETARMSASRLTSALPECVGLYCELLTVRLSVASIVVTSLWELGSVGCSSIRQSRFNYAHSVIISPKLLSRTIRLGAKNSWRENCSAAERERIRQRFSPDVTQIFAHRRFDSFAGEKCPTKKGGPSDESRTP